ncbi:MAG: spermidine/putrescine ABC transporter substrate-binding protein [Microcella sp.]|nr:spermidine/putrescine ABC transporter substrate-binding protein [Microcella sp.]
MRITRPAMAVLALASAGILTACAGTGTTDPIDPDADITEQSLTVSIWADYYPADLAERFEAETGVPVTIVNHATNEDVVAKLTTGADSGIDVAFVSGQYAQALAEQGLLADLEKSLIPNETNLYAEAAELDYDPGNVYSLPYAWGTTGLCYRPDLTGFAPTSWGDLLEPVDALDGKVTMLATERWMVLPAQKFLGFSANTTDADEMAAVRAQLESTKPQLLAFDDTTFYSKLVSGEAAMVQAWDGWCNYGIAEDPSIEFVVPSEGSDLWTDTMTVMASSQNKEAAMAFLNFILEPEVHSWVAENILYKVPNRAAMEALDPSLIEAFPNMGITPAELLEQEVLVDLGEFTVEYSRLATEIQAG